MLNNLSEVCWKWKNADIICCKLTSLVSLYQGNVKKSKKLIKIDENRTTWGVSMKFSGKLWLLIILKVTKNQCFTLSLEETFFKKPQRGSNWHDLFPPNDRILPSFLSLLSLVCLIYIFPCQIYIFIPLVSEECFWKFYKR